VKKDSLGSGKTFYWIYLFYSNDKNARPQIKKILIYKISHFCYFLFANFRRGSNECGIGKYCTVATCEKTTGKILPTPTPKSLTKQLTCDVTKTFGAGINGKTELRKFFWTTGGKSLVKV
jgi:hypothetical protein